MGNGRFLSWKEWSPEVTGVSNMEQLSYQQKVCLFSLFFQFSEKGKSEFHFDNFFFEVNKKQIPVKALFKINFFKTDFFWFFLKKPKLIENRILFRKKNRDPQRNDGVNKTQQAPCRRKDKIRGK